MDSGFALNSMSGMFDVALKIALPIMLATLVVGIVVSILQVVTQIQEMTLTFVPKILVAVFVLAVTGHWMLETLAEYTKATIKSIGGM